MPGNRLAKGNPLAKKVQQIRGWFTDCATKEDVEAVYQALLRQCLGGDVKAIAEYFDRLIGKPVETDLIERLDSLEALFEEASQ